jgi:putative ATPase
VLNRLDDAAMEELLKRAEGAENRPLPLNDEARADLRRMADGDGRYLLNMAEALFNLPAEPKLDSRAMAAIVQRRVPLYDKHQDGHYNLISALHKSLRGSDTDAALYWFARMIAGGEDPRYIARRLNPLCGRGHRHGRSQRADPGGGGVGGLRAPGLAGRRPGAGPTRHLSRTAPKSNAAYKAQSAAARAARETGS